MDEFSHFIDELDHTLRTETVSGADVVFIPTTFSCHDHHLQVELTMLQTSLNQGDNAYGATDILTRIRELVGIELADRPRASWPRQSTTRNVTITPHKVVRVIPVDMTRYGVK